MNTYLGVSAHISTADVEDVDLVTAKVLYCEGYLWDEPTAKAALRHAMDHARQVSTPVAFTLSDSFCVDRHRAEFLDLVADHVDILFANEAEICSLYQVDDFEEAARRVAGHVGIACLTRSERGSVVITSDGARVDAPAAAADVVDTTGAGDLYAAGFLSRWAAGADMAECARVASLVAAEVISHMGARPEADLQELVGA